MGAEGRGGMFGLRDEPEDSTVLPVPTGDPELSGSLLATAEPARHPVGESKGRLPAGGRWGGGIPTLGKRPQVPLCLFPPG